MSDIGEFAQLSARFPGGARKPGPNVSDTSLKCRLNLSDIDVKLREARPREVFMGLQLGVPSSARLMLL
jgi:hypothetical protein